MPYIDKKNNLLSNQFHNLRIEVQVDITHFKFHLAEEGCLGLNDIDSL